LSALNRSSPAERVMKSFKEVDMIDIGWVQRLCACWEAYWMNAWADVRVTHHSPQQDCLSSFWKKIFVNDRKPRHVYLLEVPDCKLERIREASHSACRRRHLNYSDYFGKKHKEATILLFVIKLCISRWTSEHNSIM
jgi:hypothetical protein